MRVIELKFFSRAISSDDKVEKEIEIQREAVQLTDGAGQKFEGNPNSNCCGCVREWSEMCRKWSEMCLATLLICYTFYPSKLPSRLFKYDLV